MLRHPLAQTELDPAYVLTRWPQLPDHIRQTIMTLVRSVDSTTAPPAATIKKRSSARTEKWDKTSFFNSLASYQTSEEVRVAETLTEWLEIISAAWIGELESGADNYSQLFSTMVLSVQIFASKRMGMCGYDFGD